MKQSFRSNKRKWNPTYVFLPNTLKLRIFPSIINRIGWQCFWDVHSFINTVVLAARVVSKLLFCSPVLVLFGSASKLWKSRQRNQKAKKTKCLSIYTCLPFFVFWESERVIVEIYFNYQNTECITRIMLIKVHRIKMLSFRSWDSNELPYIQKKKKSYVDFW